MKIFNIFVVVVVMLFSSAIAECNEWQDINTSVNEKGLDTPIHIAIGAAGAALTYHYLPDDMDPWLRKGVAFAVPVVIAAIKETTDKKPDGKDVAEYALGSGVAITIIHFKF